MSNFCEHYGILDHSTGTEVCAYCALVLSENLSFDEVHFNGKNQSKDDKTRESNKMLVDGVDNVPSFIKTVGDRINLCNATIENAIENFEKLLQKDEKIRNSGIMRPRKICTNLNIATYSIYNTLKQEGNPRPLKDVCGAAGISSTVDIWKLEKYFTRLNQKYFTRSSQNKILTAKDLLYGYYSYLDLSFNDANSMIRMLEFLPTSHGFTPTTTAASIMYLYINKIKKSKCSLIKIAQLFQTSTMSIHRFMKRSGKLVEEFNQYQK